MINTLQHVEISQDTPETISPGVLEKLGDLVNTASLDNSSFMEGVLTTSKGYLDTADTVQQRFPLLTINIQEPYIRFSDSEVYTVLLNHLLGDEYGITVSDVSSLDGGDSPNSFNRWFRENTAITNFTEFELFGFSIDSITLNRAFLNTTSLLNIAIPSITPTGVSYMFCISNSNNTNTMVSIDISNIDFSKNPSTAYMFCNRKNLETIIGIDKVTNMGDNMLSNTKVKLRSLPKNVNHTGFSLWPFAPTTIQTYPLYNSHIFSWHGTEDNLLPYTDFEDNYIKIDNYNLILKNNQILGAYALLYSKLKEITNVNVTSYSGYYPLYYSKIEKVTLNENVTSISPSLFSNALYLSDVKLSNITSINRNWALNATHLGAIFKKLTTIADNTLNTPIKYMVLDLLLPPTKFTTTGNLSNNGYKIYVPDTVLGTYLNTTNWSTLYNLGIIKSMTDFFNDFPEDSDKIDNKPKSNSINFGGYPMDIVPASIKTPINVEITSQGVKSVIWSDSIDKHYKKLWFIDTSNNTAEIEATSLLDDSITIRKTVSIIPDESFITEVKAKYPSYSDIIEANKELIISNPNIIPMLGKISTIHIDQTQSDCSLMITGDTAISLDFNDSINVIAWIRNNSHCYVIEDYTETTDAESLTIIPHANIKLLSDFDKSKYADGSDAPITTKDVVMKLPKFYFKIVGSNYDENSKCNLDFDISFAAYKVDDTWTEWDDTLMIGVYKAYATEGNTSSGNIYSISDLTPTVNVSYNNFKSKCNFKGEGYRLINFESHSIMGILFYAYYGNTNSQSICGSGNNSTAKTIGYNDFLGMRDTSIPGGGNVYSINFWGLENWWGDSYEWIDNLYTVGSWTTQGCKAYDIAMWEKGINTSPSLVQTTSKLIFNSPVINQIIRKIDFTDGLLIPKVYINIENYNTYYADHSYVNNGTGYVAVRSYGGSDVRGGVASFNAAYYGPVDTAVAYIGTRLLYKGTYDIIK